MSNSQASFEEKMLFVEQVYYCAVYSVFVWDWAICVVREWREIWKRAPRLTLAKILYLCCRYWPLFTGPLSVWMYTSSHTLEECRPIFRLPMVFAVVNQLAALGAFALRTQTLLGSGLRFFIALAIVLLAVVAYQLYVALEFLAPRPFLGPSLGTCLPEAQSSKFLGYFLAPFLFMAILTALVASHVMRMANSARAVAVASATDSTSDEPPRTTAESFLAIARREGLLYFVLTFVTYASGMGVFQGLWGKSTALLQAPLVFLFPSICACNMLLDQAAREYPGSGSAYGSFFTSRGGVGKSRSIGFAAPTRSLYSYSYRDKTEAGQEGRSYMDWDEHEQEDKVEQRPSLKVDTQVSRSRGSMLRTDSAASGARLLYHGQSDLQLQLEAGPSTGFSAGTSPSPLDVYGAGSVNCESQSAPIGFAVPRDEEDVGLARVRTPSWAARRLV